jgi:hypothetical protein
MSKKAKEGLRTVIESSSRFNTHWIFTSNESPEAFGPALKSRLHAIPFSDQGLAPLTSEHLVWISEQEGCPISSRQALAIVRNNGNDIRASINELDRHISSARFRERLSQESGKSLTTFPKQI